MVWSAICGYGISWSYFFLKDMVEIFLNSKDSHHERVRTFIAFIARPMNKYMYETKLWTHAADCKMKKKIINIYSKTCVKRPLKKTKKVFQNRLSLNAGQTYCRMLQGEHSAILSTFIKLTFVIKTFVLSIFELPFYTGFIVQ